MSLWGHGGTVQGKADDPDLMEFTVWCGEAGKQRDRSNMYVKGYIGQVPPWSCLWSLESCSFLICLVIKHKHPSLGWPSSLIQNPPHSYSYYLPPPLNSFLLCLPSLPEFDLHKGRNSRLFILCPQCPAPCKALNKSMLNQWALSLDSAFLFGSNPPF